MASFLFSISFSLPCVHCTYKKNILSSRGREGAETGIKSINFEKLSCRQVFFFNFTVNGHRHERIINIFIASFEHFDANLESRLKNKTQS